MDLRLLEETLGELPANVRLQRAVDILRARFQCDGVGLLALDNDSLRLVAASGMPREALGRRFAVAQHPRFATILARREPTIFPPDSVLPDPYDGLLDDQQSAPLPVHDCMGVSLHCNGKLWGALTLDDLVVGTFDPEAVASLQQYAILLSTVIRLTSLEQENHRLRLLGSSAHGPEKILDQHEILGDSAAIARLLQELDVVAGSDVPVLLLGETGVGKDMFARRLHRHSARHSRPMVHVNCAALPDSLAESELFGHVKGAFSGAGSDRAGRFETARGGTLFLDEVGELSLPIQAKLLRTLQNGEIQRLGTDEHIKTDVRILAATNRNLRERVREGSFRADLYHRLSVYPVNIPPLRDRGNDILLLAGHYLEFNRTRLGLRGIRLSPDAERAMLAYSWPGNVRELEHVISRAAIKTLSQGAARDQIMTLEAPVLDLDVQPRDREQQGLVSDHGQATAASMAAYGTLQPLRATVDAAQRHAIRQALAASGENWSQAARRLDVDASNLHKLARRLGMKPC